MDITEIRVSLTEQSSDRLRAFCSITFDDMFVVRDIKIIDGPKGPFVAMPSRRIMSQCPRCSTKNHLRARFCNDCGCNLPSNDDPHANNRLYADIAHPINAECREFVQNSIIQAFEQELQQSQQPGYQRKLNDDELATQRSPRSHRPAPHQRQSSDHNSTSANSASGSSASRSDRSN